MGTVVRAAKELKWDETKFTEALEFIKMSFEIPEFLDDQVRALRSFFQGKKPLFLCTHGLWKVPNLRVVKGGSESRITGIKWRISRFTLNNMAFSRFTEKKSDSPCVLRDLYFVWVDY